MLAAIRARVVRRLAGIVSHRILDPRRTPVPRLVTNARPFDFDNLRAKIREDLRAQRAREGARKVNYSNSVKWSGHRFTSSSCLCDRSGPSVMDRAKDRRPLRAPPAIFRCRRGLAAD